MSALLHSGLRKSELFSLRWQHVDLRHETVTVTSLKRGGGGEGHTDTLPIFPEFAQILRRLHSETKPLPGELIFGIDSTERGKILNGAKPSKRGTVAGRDCFADYRLLSKLKRYAKFAKIDWADSLTIHDLRHTFCTELARTTSLAVVKDFARHKDISTTLRYVHPGWDAMKAATKNLSYASNVVDISSAKDQPSDAEQAENPAHNVHMPESNTALG